MPSTLRQDRRTATVRAAIGLTFFAGLRPGEARGVRWEDYDGKHLTVEQSCWHTHTTAPKTEYSVKPVPVIEPLRVLPNELRQADDNPKTGPILRAVSGKPLSLDNLARREIIPALRKCAVCHQLQSEHEANGHEFQQDTSLPRWRGFYSFRRGIGTLTTAIAKDPLAAKGLLRHSNLSTTMAHYIHDVPEVTQQAMGMVEQLFGDCATVVQPQESRPTESSTQDAVN